MDGEQMNQTQITELDTFDTLKYGHIPTDSIITTMKEKHGDEILNDFDIDDLENEISFIQFIPIKYDDMDGKKQGIMISCYILQPDEESDKISFMFDMDTSTRELSINNYMNTFKEIHKRSDLDNIRMEWQEFIGLCFIEILKYYKENETEVAFDVPLMLSHIAEDICYFKHTNLL